MLPSIGIERQLVRSTCLDRLPLRALRLGELGRRLGVDVTSPLTGQSMLVMPALPKGPRRRVRTRRPLRLAIRLAFGLAVAMVARRSLRVLRRLPSVLLPVPFTHLTLPANLSVELVAVAGC